MNASTGLRHQVRALESGLRIAFAERSSRSSKGTLVCLHGFTDSWFSFSRLIDRLSPDRNVIAIDLRGHGQSARPPSGYTMSQMALDVIGLLDALELEDVTLVGHSMGSLVAQHAAALSSDRIARLVLIGSTATTRAADVQELSETLESLEGNVPAELIREFQLSTIQRPLPKTFLERVCAESARVPLTVWRRALAGMLAYRSQEVLPLILQPTLLLWGREDAYFTRSDQQDLLAALPARLVELPGVGHAPHWEVPNVVASELERFVRTVRSHPEAMGHETIAPGSNGP